MPDAPDVLVPGYTVRHVDEEEFMDRFKPLHALVFEQLLDYPFWTIASDEAKAARDRLRRERFTVRLLVEHDGEVVGWTLGTQRDAACFTMNNSGVLPDHRGRGIYTALMQRVLDATRDAGFQVVMSCHHPTNNAVLIPKLRAGFVINGFEISDIWGTLVSLAYYFDPRRREAFGVRVGHARPSPELMRALGLGPEKDDDDAG